MRTAPANLASARTPDHTHPWVIVVAHAHNRAIGLDDGSLPWRLPNDLSRFRSITAGHAVVMGRKTYETLPKPLDQRTNIVVSRRSDWHDPDHPEVVHAPCLDLAADRHTESDHAAKPLIILGGGEIYAEALPRVGVIERTLVEAEPAADVFFPELDPDEWVMALDEPHPADARHTVPYRFQRLLRRT